MPRQKERANRRKIGGPENVRHWSSASSHADQTEVNEDTRKLAFFKFYGDTFYDDTAGLSGNQQSLLMALYWIAWRRPECGLPDEDRDALRVALKRHCTWLHGNHFNAIVPDLLKRFFVLGPDGIWRSNWQQIDRHLIEKKSASAQETANKRWAETREIKALANAKAMLTDTDTEKDTDACRSPYGEAALRPRSVTEADLAYGRSRGLSKHDVIARYDAMVSQYAAKGEVIRHPSALLRTFIDAAAAEIAKLRKPLNDEISWDGECDDEIPLDDEIPF
jgi:hypothetical protein